VRGVRLFSDGIPATSPDGQGQFSHFDLTSAGRIEILRGPFSALYGNASGGVISVYTEDAPPGMRVVGSADYGSFNTRRYGLKGMGDTGNTNFVINASRFQTDGYRDHSGARRDILNARSRWEIGESVKLTLVANALNSPNALDPRGLDRVQLLADPRQAGAGAYTFNTNKSVEQEQLGLNYEQSFGAHNTLNAMVYGGRRETTQFLAIPPSAQNNPRHPGGVINLVRNYRGIDVHLTDRRTAGDTTLQLTAGITYDGIDESRRSYQNFIGSESGVQGAMRAAGATRFYNFDEYLQVQWSQRRWLASAGVRHGDVSVRSRDHLVASGGDNSSVSYRAWSPVAGLSFRIAEPLHAYAAYSRGFETPTTNDLAYRSTDGSIPGMNIDLKPSWSDNYEIGLKLEKQHLAATLAGFHIQARDELAVRQNAGGRSVYQNIPETERKGAEFSVTASLPKALGARLAYTYIKAITRGDYASCAGSPCLPIVVRDGSRVPAVPENSAYIGLTWAPLTAFSMTVETIGRSRIYVDDLNSDATDSYWLANAHIDLKQRTSMWDFSESLRVDNITNRRYVGSVIVNEGNRRFFEPGAERAVYLMVSATWRAQP
jgi:iron complex outermembrane receptor protein